ncbi:MAG TPA: AtpZ/AtpI family protein [Daejeonella sp.]|nr:AtpZ/AtpI family protein [Daejeonella sp.]
MQTEEENKDELKSEKKALNSYVKYSAMGFQMIAIIGICTFIGYKIDENRHAHHLLVTALFSLIGVALALFLIIRSVKNNQS